MTRRIRQAAITLLAVGAMALLPWGCTKPEPVPPRPDAMEVGKPAARHDPAADNEWNTYHGSPALDGVAHVKLPDRLALRWRFKASGAVLNTPVATDGRLYFSNDKGLLFAVDLEGREVWSRTLAREATDDAPPVQEQFDAPLACFDGTVVAASAEGVVYALDAATGQEQWRMDLDGYIMGTPNLRPASEGRPGALFVIEQGEGALHCLDFATGKPLWRTEGVDRCDGSAGVGEDVVVFGSCAAALHVFSATDGALLREIEIDGDSQVAAGVALVGDSVFAASRSGKLVHANTRTGAAVWVSEACQDEAFSTPAVNDDWVLFSAEDGRVYTLDRNTGQQKWTSATDGSPSSPVIAGDKVVVASDGTLYLLRLADGGEVWSYEVSDQITSPAVVGDLVVVGSEDGTVAAFGAAKEPTETPL